jgi:acyl-coenzyme A thioesterase PaaI-like protein
MQAWHVLFVARGKVGPFRADGEAVRGAGSKVGVRVSLYDEGDDERLVTAASASFEIVG